LLFAQAARFSELLVVKHVLCEHGALLHAEAQREPHQETQKEELLEQEQTIRAEYASSFEHEHCEGVGIVHRPDNITPLLVEPTLLAELLLVESPPKQVERRIALLLEAPKASPPVLS
jgi:hypothetical protein